MSENQGLWSRQDREYGGISVLLHVFINLIRNAILDPDLRTIGELYTWDLHLRPKAYVGDMLNKIIDVSRDPSSVLPGL